MKEMSGLNSYLCIGRMYVGPIPPKESGVDQHEFLFKGVWISGAPETVQIGGTNYPGSQVSGYLLDPMGELDSLKGVSYTYKGLDRLVLESSDLRHALRRADGELWVGSSYCVMGSKLPVGLVACTIHEREFPVSDNDPCGQSCQDVPSRISDLVKAGKIQRPDWMCDTPVGV